ncbi:MAG: ABC transporter ATP-binding protein/permease [Burkholderiales bacterium]|jgi:putative ATP-binding cassette transporter
MSARFTFLRDTWRLIKPYWKSEERFIAWLLLASVVILTLAMVYMNVLFNDWYNSFYNALQEKDKTGFWKLMGRFCILATIYIVMAVYEFYLNQMLQIRWRRWLTDNYLSQWLSDRAYYRLQLSGNPADNPDQRISEDMKFFVDQSLELSLGLLNATVTLGSFVGILWGLSGPLEIPLNGNTVSIQGYMVWAALFYAIVGTWLTHHIGKKLIGLNFSQQRFEADFRFSLVRFRENAEGVALYKGEPDEFVGFRARFASVVDNWWRIMKRQKILNFFTIGYNQAAIIFPFLVAGNRYFAGSIQLGGLMQISNAFGHVQSSLSWFITAYPTFATWKATSDRLIGFHNAIEKARAQARDNSSAERTVEQQSDIQLENLAVALPDARPLVAASTLDIKKGESLLIRGPSGSGKSTLFRAIAGIWPYSSGRIRLPKDGRILFLPQKTYLPIGTLKQVTVYPSMDASFSDEAIKNALSEVGLAHLRERLDEQENWSLQLSPGEQQRIAFARALLQQPDWLFLDEATSSLDEEAEQKLYRILEEKLPRTTVISIGHRSTLQAFHKSTIEMKTDNAGLRVLAPA